MALVLLECPPSISKPDSPSNEATKNPAELYSTGFLYPIALIHWHQSLLGKPTISKKPASPFRRNPSIPQA